MNRYFARLAQRTGLIDRPLTTPDGARDTGNPPDIVEQDRYVDAAAPADPAAPPGVPEATMTGPERAAKRDAQSLSGAEAASDRVAPPMESRAREATALAATNRPSVTEQLPRKNSISSRAPNIARSSGVDEPASVRKTVAREESPAQTSRASALRDAAASIDNSIETPEREAPGASGRNSSARAEPVRAIESMQRHIPNRARSEVPAESFSTTDDDIASSISKPPRRTGAPISKPAVSAPTRDKNAAASGPIEKNIDVRIGAVRLEIHAPASPSADASPPPSAPAPEPRRFSPGRYYLRG